MTVVEVRLFDLESGRVCLQVKVLKFGKSEGGVGGTVMLRVYDEEHNLLLVSLKMMRS